MNSHLFVWRCIDYDNRVRTNMNIIIIIVMTSCILNLTTGRGYDTSVVPYYNRLRHLSFTYAVPVTKLAQHYRSPVSQKQCNANVLIDCPPVYSIDFTSNQPTNIRTNSQIISEGLKYQGSLNSVFKRTAQISSDQPLLLNRMINRGHDLNKRPLYGRLDGYVTENVEYPFSRSGKLNMKLDSFTTKRNTPVRVTTESSINHSLSPTTFSNENPLYVEGTTTASTVVTSSTIDNSFHEVSIFEKKSKSLDNFERKFYTTTFSKLTSISPASRRENGMSFVQSGLFLHLSLMALSTEVDPETRREIDECLGLHESDQERIDLINATLSSLPASRDDLKFRWSSRLVLQSQNISDRFRTQAAPALRLRIDRFNGTETAKEMAIVLNRMVEEDSGGAIHNTFEEEDMALGARAVLVTTLYLRARWRAAPTLLNGTRPFRDSARAPRGATRMIRLNDVMRYADLTEWDAEALEIFYSTPGLSLLMLVPRGNSLKRLAGEIVGADLGDIAARMRPARVAATLPLYTLRMTLLLPNKLEIMNISRLVDASSETQDEFRLSHAVQRIMFWAEAGRNAFKDDGLEWDEQPQRELVVDRPYIFYVRWNNVTLMNGNFVL